MHPLHQNDILDRPALERLQVERLRETLRRVIAHVPFYRESFRAAGVGPEDIRGIDDVRRLPFTTKQDLRDHYPFGLFAVPLAEVARIHASSGTTGKMTVVGYTRRDLESWAEVCARSFGCAGVRPRRHRAQRLRLRALHRRARRALRRRAARGDRDPDLGRQHQAPDHDHAGLRRHGAHLHALLRAEPRRDDPGAGRRPRFAQAARGHLRRRAVVRGDAQGDREEAAPHGARHLRPHRDHRPRGGDGVPREAGAARLRGPLPRRGHRPGHRRGRSRRARAASWSSPR